MMRSSQKRQTRRSTFTHESTARRRSARDRREFLFIRLISPGRTAFDALKLEEFASPRVDDSGTIEGVETADERGLELLDEDRR